jgi:hypothetical protein
MRSRPSPDRTSPDRRNVSARFASWRGTLTKPSAWVVVSGLTMALILTLAGVAAAGGFGLSAASSVNAGAGGPASGNAAGNGSAGNGSAGNGSSGGTAARTAAGRDAAGRPQTSCQSVAHIGDSTSADLISPVTLPHRTQRLAAQYADVGVQHLWLNASGGRSIVEVLPGQVNGYNVARGWWAHGFRGCWVFALGTNDAANVSVGSAVGITARIDRMMAVAHGEPVLWVNTKTMLSSGPWSEVNERAWDTALVRALARYPNMRILNWAAVAKPGWFLSDGIHYNSVGCAARAEAIADGLAKAFPSDARSDGQSHGHIVT